MKIYRILIILLLLVNNNVLCQIMKLHDFKRAVDFNSIKSKDLISADFLKLNPYMVKQVKIANAEPISNFLLNKQKLDSIISNDNEKSEFHYNDAGKMSKYVEYDREISNQNWVPAFKIEYEYDFKNNLKLSQGYDWNKDNNTWDNRSRVEHEYNHNGKILNSLFYWQVPQSTDLRLSLKYEYTYDEKENLIHQKYSVFDEGTNSMANKEKVEYKYDSLFNLVQKFNYDWSLDSIKWLIKSKNDYSYDTSGKVIETIYFIYRNNLQNWENFYKGNYFYDTNNFLISTLSSGWDKFANVWKNPTYKTEMHYDSNNNMVNYSNLSWNENESKWEIIFNEVITYNNSYHFDELIWPYFSPYEYKPLFNHMVTSILGYHAMDNGNLTVYESLYHYSDYLSTTSKDIETQSILLLPNPTSDIIKIESLGNDKLFNFELFDLSGKCVLTLSGSNDAEVSLNHLTCGTYIYKIINNAKLSTGKIVLIY